MEEIGVFSLQIVGKTIWNPCRIEFSVYTTLHFAELGFLHLGFEEVVKTWLISGLSSGKSFKGPATDKKNNLVACFIISWCDSQLSDHHSVGAEFYQGFF